MSLRKARSVMPAEQQNAGFDLVSAVDEENEQRVLMILRFCSGDSGSPYLTQDQLDTAFKLAVGHCSESCTKLFLVTDRPLASQTLIDDLLDDVFEEGTNPSQINLLQTYATQRKLMELERRLAAHRKARYFAGRTPYLVSLSETSTIDEIRKRQAQFADRLSRPMIVKSKFEMILRDQSWVNRMLFDAVFAHLKLTVALLLSMPSSANDLLPDQGTVNEVFLHSVKKGYLSMAEMLLTCPVTTDQAGFDHAFQMALELPGDEVTEWLLSGRYGFVPTQTLIDELYMQHARLLGPMSPHHEWMSDYRMQQRLGGIFGGQRGIRFRMRVHGMPPNAEVLLQEYKSHETIAKRLTQRASPEVLRKVEKQRKQAQARWDALQRVRELQDESEDIHHFSHTVVAEEEAVGAVVAATEMQGVEEGDEGQEDRVGEGEVADPLEVPLVGADAGEVPAAANPWEAPAAGRRPTRSRPLTVHTAVLQNLERRVGDNILSPELVTQRMGELIAQHFPAPEEQTRTMRYVSRFMSEANVRSLGLALQFITSFHSDAVGMWLHGFLGESIAVDSCHAGAVERIVTGLRGIEDPELQEIFRQAEGPNLARLFLIGTFNVYYSEHDEDAVARGRQNAAQLAVELVRHGITLESTEDEVKQRLLQYAREAVNSYRAGLDRVLADSIDTVVMTVVDGYEDYLLPAVREALLEAQRLQEEQVQFMQDGELQEGCCGQESKDETA
jgi:hypothetical protein